MNKVKVKVMPAETHVKVQYEGEELTIKELVGRLEYLKGSQEYLKWAVVEREKEIALLKKQLADVQPVKHGQWIRVEDEKPDTGQYVLVNHKDGVMQCAQYISGYDDRELWVLDHYYKEQGEITHWMPLPEPPKERYKCRYADDNGVCSKCSGNGEIIYCIEGPCPYDLPEEVRDDGAHIEP